MSRLEDDVCPVDGVPVGATRSGTLVHLDDLPSGVPEHVVDRVSREAYEAKRDQRADLRAAAADMVLHHATMHPAGECDWTRRLTDALRR